MKPEWLEFLADPIDGSALEIVSVEEGSADRITEGRLRGGSGAEYSIRNRIPVLLAAGSQSQASVESFAYEWEEFGFLFARDGWVSDIAGPLLGGTDAFRGKVVVDAGAGSGAQSRWIAEAGAKLVISLELSSAVFGRHRASVNDYSDRVCAVQCDITRPPVRPPVDIVYCVNVLQHTSNPAVAFETLGSLVADDGIFVVNMYVKRSEMKFRVVRVARRLIRFLPFPVWKWTSFGIAAVAYPAAQVPFLRRAVRIFVPISHDFRETWLDVYDAFGGHHYQENMRLEDQLALFEANGFQILVQGTFGFLLGRAGSLPAIQTQAGSGGESRECVSGNRRDMTQEEKSKASEPQRQG